MSVDEWSATSRDLTGRISIARRAATGARQKFRKLRISEKKGMERNGQGVLSALEVYAVEELKGAEDQLANLHEALWVSPTDAEAETARLSKLTVDAEEDAEMCRKHMAKVIEGAESDDWGNFARKSFLPRAESLPIMKMPPGFSTNAPQLSAATSLRISKEGANGHGRTIPHASGNSFREKVGAIGRRTAPLHHILLVHRQILCFLC